jgi:2-iminobutanoate/2-iminopropanoate deaminase
VNIVPVSAKDAPAALGRYSHAVRLGGFIFCSGQIGIDPESRSLLDGTVAAETTHALENLERVLEAGRSSIDHLRKTTIYLVETDDFAEMNGRCGEHFADHRLARVTVEVSRLPADARVEIDCVAVRTDAQA